MTARRPCRFLIVAGMPRSGSMWVYNVSRHLLAAAGHRVQPETVPQVDRRAAALIDRALARPDDAVCCLKIHSKLRRLPPETKLIVNIRDVRDAMVSYMRFMRCGFERGIEAVEGMMTLTDYYTAFTGADRLVVRYEDLVGRPRATVETIAGFLSLRLRDKVLNIVEREWSRENVLAKIAATEKDLEQRKRDRAPILPIEVAPNADGTVRAYDTRTGFQSGHISAEGGKGWRNPLTPPQQERLLALTRSWLEKHRFVE